MFAECLPARPGWTRMDSVRRSSDMTCWVARPRATAASVPSFVGAHEYQPPTNARDAQMTNIARQRSRPSNQSPLASIAPYGPDNTFATKLVVSVLERPGQREPSTMRMWTTQAVDVRHDPTIAGGVADFLREYGVKHTVTSDRIMGCPHQASTTRCAAAARGVRSGRISIDLRTSRDSCRRRRCRHRRF